MNTYLFVFPSAVVRPSVCLSVCLSVREMWSRDLRSCLRFPRRLSFGHTALSFRPTPRNRRRTQTDADLRGRIAINTTMPNSVVLASSLLHLVVDTGGLQAEPEFLPMPESH